MDNAAWFSAFDAYLARTGRSPGTRRKYGEALSRFAAWLGDQPPTSLRPSEMDSFIGQWQQEFVARRGRTPSPATYRLQIAALRSLFNWAERFERGFVATLTRCCAKTEEYAAAWVA